MFRGGLSKCHGTAALCETIEAPPQDDGAVEVILEAPSNKGDVVLIFQLPRDDGAKGGMVKALQQRRRDRGAPWPKRHRPTAPWGRVVKAMFIKLDLI